MCKIKLKFVYLWYDIFYFHFETERFDIESVNIAFQEKYFCYQRESVIFQWYHFNSFFQHRNKYLLIDIFVIKLMFNFINVEYIGKGLQTVGVGGDQCMDDAWDKYF